jgi:hypothetical protein
LNGKESNERVRRYLLLVSLAAVFVFVVFGRRRGLVALPLLPLSLLVLLLLLLRRLLFFLSLALAAAGLDGLGGGLRLAPGPAGAFATFGCAADAFIFARDFAGGTLPLVELTQRN